MFGHQVERQRLCHLVNDDFGLCGSVGRAENLSARDGRNLGMIGLDVADAAWFPSPGMVYEQFGIDAKKFVQQVLAAERHTCQLAHGVHPIARQLLGRAASHTPKVGQRSVAP